MGKRLFTVKEVSEYLSFSESSIKKLMNRREIPYIKILNKVFFKQETIDAWLDSEMTLNPNRNAIKTFETKKEQNRKGNRLCTNELSKK